MNMVAAGQPWRTVYLEVLNQGPWGWIITAELVLIILLLLYIAWRMK